VIIDRSLKESRSEVITDHRGRQVIRLIYGEDDANLCEGPPAA